VKEKTLRSCLCVLASLTFSILSSNLAVGQSEIVGISIACSNDHVYTWYSDGTVSVGTSENLSAYEAPHFYSLPFGKTPADIVEIGIAGNDHVYTWYRDQTLSVGTSTDLDKYQPRHPDRLTLGTSPDSIVGIDIACSNDHVYAWFRDGRVSSGTSDDLDKYQTLSRFTPGSFKSAFMIVGIGIAGNDHVYAWYTDHKASSGTSTLLSKYRAPYDYVPGPGPCDISADPPTQKGSLVSSVGIRGPECKSSAEITVRLVSIVPSLQKGVGLAEKRLTGSNFEVPIFYECRSTTGQNKVVTEVQTKDRVVRSSERTILNCH